MACMHAKSPLRAYVRNRPSFACHVSSPGVAAWGVNLKAAWGVACPPGVPPPGPPGVPYQTTRSVAVRRGCGISSKPLSAYHDERVVSEGRLGCGLPAWRSAWPPGVPYQTTRSVAVRRGCGISSKPLSAYHDERVVHPNRERSRTDIHTPSASHLRPTSASHGA